MPDFEILAKMVGLDWPTVLAFVGVGVVIAAFAKDKFPKVTGYWIDGLIAALMLGLNYAAYAPKIVPVIVGTVFCYIGSVGGWAGMKQIAHKVGTAPTPK